MHYKSYAKVNLALDILGKDPQTGYHFINTIMTEVPRLYDELEIKLTQKPEIIIECDNQELPTDSKNTMYQAALLIQKEFQLQGGVHIRIKKNIPLESGLGGGSSNAACILKVLNEQLNLNISNAELEKLAAEIGIDVPFFITGGTAYCTHYGEKIEQLPTLKNHMITIHASNHRAQTESVFNKIDLSKCGKQQEKTQQMYEILKQQKEESIIAYIHNDFESLYTKKENQHLTGSGSARFSIDAAPQVL